jgi:hypothetical protein
MKNQIFKTAGLVLLVCWLSAGCSRSASSPRTTSATGTIEMVKVNGAWRGGHTRAYDASWDDGSEAVSL